MDRATRNALLCRPHLWPQVAWRITDTLLVRRRTTSFVGPDARECSDPELAISRERANGVLQWVRESSAAAATAQFDELLSRSRLADDTYSCSQRLSHAAYLHRLGAGLAISQPALLRLRADAATIAAHPEFRLQNAWFNNHLLNNYRALLLARTELHNAIADARVDAAADRLDGLLVRFADTLFEGGRGPVLAEGSVSYELLILRHLFDIVCSGGNGAFAKLARKWLLDEAVAYVARYRWKDRWLLPAIGDISPDWRRADVEDFLDGVFLGAPTVYRSLWPTQLAALRLPALTDCR